MGVTITPLTLSLSKGRPSFPRKRELRPHPKRRHSGESRNPVNEIR